jgi:hypothetical protein
MYKKFDKKLHEENDKKGKEFAVKIIQKIYPNYNIVEGSKFGVDLKVVDPKDCTVHREIEIEVRSNWSGDLDFPFDTVNIPERKRKFFNGLCTYVSINKNLNRCLLIKDEDILKSPLVENSNKYVASGERFFKVPISKCKSIIVGGDKNDTSA